MYKLDKMTPANWILFLTSVIALIQKNRTQSCNETSIISCMYDRQNQKCVCENMDCVPHEQICFHVEALELTLGTYTYIPSQAFTDYYRLKFLTISNSAVQEIHSGAFDGLNLLEKLHLKSNKLEIIYPRAFDGLFNLTLINLQDNYIQYLPHGLFYDLKQISLLFLSGNPFKDSALEYFDQPMPLTLLHLERINMTSLLPGCFKNLPNLQILSLTGNFLETIEMGTFQDLPSLLRLDLSKNNLKTIAEKSFRSNLNLTHLFININNMANFQQLLRTLPSNLEFLSVYANNFTQIGGLKTGQPIKLINLDISFNHIASLNSDSFRGLPSLEEVNLAGNELEVVDLTIFPQSIKKILLSENHIENLILPTTTDCLPHLRNLKLLNNKLKTFPVALLELTTNLNSLDLNFNPIVCDCYTKEQSSAGTTNSSILQISTHCSNSGDSAINEIPSHDASILSSNCIEPVVLAHFDHLDVLQGSTVTLNCSVTGIPHPRVTWIGPNGEALFGKYDYAHEITLLDVSDAGKANNGTYMCLAINSEGVSNASISVFVIPQKEEFSTPSFSTVMATHVPQTQATQTVLKTVTEFESIKTTIETQLLTDTPSQSEFLTTTTTSVSFQDNTKEKSTISILTSDLVSTTEVSQTRHSTSVDSDHTTEDFSSVSVEVSTIISVMGNTGTEEIQLDLSSSSPTTEVSQTRHSTSVNSDQTTEDFSSISVKVSSQISDLGNTDTEEIPLYLSSSSPNIKTTTRINRIMEEKSTIVSRILQTSVTSNQQSTIRNVIEMTTENRNIETTHLSNIRKKSSKEIVITSLLSIITVVIILALVKCLIKKVRLKLRKPMNVFLLNDFNEELWKDEEISQEEGNICESQIHVGLLSNFKEYTYG
ncbi:leucine-rich repeat and immunoglobulin-like domain-containing nogo receptor-interacting protein 2 [Anneissia japonica]|uniref:leucine-rich repeat and immunoglobulin-like domain-containing nogo receptor-interacting protein 2 n=1 Tax=Anneissia japonica TaxID=1529436 RepID=UPI001425B251|nr:leucine-rich repeat and immunoglobulin-like domain-containing nogo receptor-interacting protein 2 [Anneissia japonica]